MNINSFGRGVWADKWYIVEKCPLCHDDWTFRFLASSGFWTCPSCGEAGTELSELSKRVPYEVGAIDEPEGLLSIGRFHEEAKREVIPTGFSILDNMIGGWVEGGLTVVTGRRGEGKTTWAGRVGLNAVNHGTHVCMYSGEMPFATQASWILQQAAGPYGVEQYNDNGITRWRTKPEVGERIRRWLGDSLILYDNSIVKSTERNSILERFQQAHGYYGCEVFVIDNLMTAKYADNDSDFYRQQASFAQSLTEFAITNKSHVLLVAHPKKQEAGWGGMDENDKVAGAAEVTNFATNVVRIEKPSEKVQEALAKKGKDGCDSIMKVTKNREYGTTGDILFDFEPSTRRLIQKGGTMITRYGWEQ